MAQSSALLFSTSESTTFTVHECCEEFNLKCIDALSMSLALSLLKKGGIAIVVSALGMRESDLLFDLGGDRSSLISLCQAQQIPLVVFSHTASNNADHFRACMDAGAVGVVCEKAALSELIGSFLDSAQMGAQLADEPIAAEPYLPLIHDYPTLTLRREAGALLDAAIANQPLTKKHQVALSVFAKATQRLRLMVEPVLPRLLLSPSLENIRFVVISDTHNQHREMSLPAGDVLIHCGDFVGNYGDQYPIMEHLQDFFDWLRSLPFKRIFLVGGNHDTMLDFERYPKLRPMCQHLIESLPAHVHILQNSAIHYRGLLLWGSPFLTSRLERYGKRYYSDGHERTDAERQFAWMAIPEDVDILITHTPPHGLVGDDLLGERLASLRNPPRVHCWGHQHEGFGCGVQGNTLWLNAAQNGFLVHEPRGAGGCPLVFDLPTRD